MSILCKEIRGQNTMLLGHTRGERVNKSLNIFQQSYLSEEYSLKLPCDPISLQSKWLSSSGQMITNVDENVYTLCINDGGVNWCSHYGNQYGVFSEK